MVIGHHMLWIWCITVDVHKDGHLHRPNRRTAFQFADADTIELRLDVTALPDTSTGALGIALSPGVSAFRVTPVQSKAIAHEPLAEIGAVDRTSRNGAAKRVEAERDTVDGAPGNLSVEIVRCLRTTAVL
jgi:hypothetical protein